MTRSWIEAQEGNLVYVNHRRGGARAVVYKGTCYEIQNINPHYGNRTTRSRAELRPLDNDILVDIRKIADNEASRLELAVRDALRKNEKEVTITLSIDIGKTSD